MNYTKFFIYIAVSAGVTYLIRMLPLVLIRKEIKNKYILSFLHYIPYTVLAVMTVPAIFSSTGNLASAVVSCVVALILALFDKGLMTVACCSSVAVFAVNLIIELIAKNS